MSTLNHSFNVEHACEYGVLSAIIIHYFQFWIEQNQALGRNFHDDRTWCYQTQKEISSIYPYMSEDTIYREIKKLEERGVLKKSNYNKNSFDKTLWYAFENEIIFTKPRNRAMDPTKPLNPNLKIAEPIPDVLPVIDKIQQQQPEIAAAFFPCFDQIEIPESEKTWISNEYKKNEDLVNQAVHWAMHPTTKIEKTIQQAIKWYCKLPADQRPIPKENPQDIETSNRKLAQNYIKNAKIPKQFYFDALNQQVEIGHINGQPAIIRYDEKGFKEQLENALIKYGIKHDKTT